MKTFNNKKSKQILSVPIITEQASYPQHLGSKSFKLNTDIHIILNSLNCTLTINTVCLFIASLLHDGGRPSGKLGRTCIMCSEFYNTVNLEVASDR